MAAPLQFAYRTQKGIGITDAAPVYEPLPGFVKPEGNIRCCEYSPCGRYFAWADPQVVKVVNATDGQLVLTLPLLNVYELGFSPLGTFLVTWERPGKDENGDASKNLKVWRIIEEGVPAEEKQPLGRYVQKSQGGWNLQYTADEKFCARLVTNEVQFYESHDLRTVWNKLRVEGVSDFALGPGEAHSVAVFVPERKGQPAVVKVYNVPQFAQAISQKTFFKGDKVQLKWNSQGTSILVLAQTDVDKSNKSYYGETTLYLLSVNGSFDARVALDKEGPIHDVTWSPNSKEFGVVYGYMPAKTTIFNHRAVVTHSFPIGPRNTITFSPTGRFALVAGFGNLAGHIDLYDLEKDFRKICTIESGNPSVCSWSPDSRYIMTATTSPRLRVDNGVKLWHVGGTLMYHEDMVELYSVLWRPMDRATGAAAGDPLSPVPTPHASATTYLGTIKTPSKPAGAYRPPGARGLATPLHFKREDEGGSAHVVGNGTPLVNMNGFGRPRRAVPGAEPVQAGGVPGMIPGAEVADGDDSLSKAAQKNKKKRGNRKAKEGEGKELAGGGASLAPPARDQGAGYGSEGRSPERRGQGRNQRSQSRNPGVRRNRSNTTRGPNGAPHGPGQAQGPGYTIQGGGIPQEGHGQAADAQAAAAAGGADANQNPNAKKIRSLQKKVRAIEDLEMRLAGGEKLEDTQMKKMATKSAVLKELETLEKA